MIYISYLKQYTIQTNDYFLIEIPTRNHINVYKQIITMEQK